MPKGSSDVFQCVDTSCGYNKYNIASDTKIKNTLSFVKFDFKVKSKTNKEIKQERMDQAETYLRKLGKELFKLRPQGLTSKSHFTPLHGEKVPMRKKKRIIKKRGKRTKKNAKTACIQKLTKHLEEIEQSLNHIKIENLEETASRPCR